MAELRELAMRLEQIDARLAELTQKRAETLAEMRPYLEGPASRAVAATAIGRTGPAEVGAIRATGQGVLAFVKDRGEVVIRDVLQAFPGLAYNSAAAHLSRLSAAGRIQKSGRGCYVAV